MAVTRPFNTQFRYCATDVTGQVFSDTAALLEQSTSLLCQPWLLDTLPTPTPISQTGNVVTFASLAEFDAKKNSLQPGDIFTAVGSPGTTISGQFDIRGNDVDGAGANIEGTPGNHITITSQPGVTLTAPATGFNTVISVRATKHFDVINCNIDGGVFGIIYRCVRSTAGSRSRIANNNVLNTTDAHVGVQGWFANVSQPGFVGTRGESTYVDVYGNYIAGSPTNSGQSEGIYIGTGSLNESFNDRTSNIRCYGNEITNITSDGFDVKPGTTNWEITDNYLHDMVFSGTPCCPVAAISGMYAIDPLPAGFPSNANGLIARNRISNLSGFAGGLRAIDVGYGDITVESNIGWNTGTAFIRVQTESQYGQPGSVQPINILCNSTNEGTLVEVINQGGVTLPAINQDDNMGPSTQHPLTVIGPTTGTADAGEGPGSGFVLSPGTGGQGSAGCTDATGCTANSPSDQGALAVA